MKIKYDTQYLNWERKIHYVGVILHTPYKKMGNWTGICASKFEVYFNSDTNIALKEIITELSPVYNHNSIYSSTLTKL